LRTSSTVIGSRIIARLFLEAQARVATATEASCSSVVPYFFMWATIGTVNVEGGPMVPYGASNWPDGELAPPPMPPIPMRERPLSPCVIST